MVEDIIAYNWHKEGSLYLTDNFQVKEFKCQKEPIVFISKSLLECLQYFRSEVKSPVNITSGYRNYETNLLCGGSSNSAHLYGAAADFFVTGISSLEAARKLSKIFINSCIGYYERTDHVHFQLSNKKQRYLVTKNGISKWVNDF